MQGLLHSKVPQAKKMWTLIALIPCMSQQFRISPSELAAACWSAFRLICDLGRNCQEVNDEARV